MADNQPSQNTPQEADALYEREQRAEEAENEINQEAKATAPSGNLQNDVNAVLGVKKEPVNETAPQSVAERLSIIKDVTYPGAARAPQKSTEEGPKESVAEQQPAQETLVQSAQKPLTQTEKPQTENPATPQPAPEKTEVPPTPQTIDATEKTNEGAGRHVAIRTLQGDIANSVKTKKTSLASIAVAESTRQAQQKEPLKEKPEKKKRIVRGFLIGLGILLILGGIGALGAVAFLSLSNTSNTPGGDTTPPLIFVNSQLSAEVPETRFGTLDALTDAKDRATNLNLGHIGKLNLTPRATTTPLSLDGFITRLSTNIPGSLMRTFTGRYLLGIHSLPYNEYLLVLEIEDRESAFASMLRWEPDMASDLPFLVREETQATRTAGETIGTTTPATLESPEIFTNRTIFVDRIIENRDVRVLLDSNGDIRFGYALPRPDILVIANNESSFIELFDRLSGVRFNE